MKKETNNKELRGFHRFTTGETVRGLNNDDIKVIENFLNEDPCKDPRWLSYSEPVMTVNEIQAIVRMQYEIYKRLMMPAFVISRKELEDDSI